MLRQKVRASRRIPETFGAFEAPVLDDKLKANGKFDSLKELTDVSYNGDEEDCYRICLNTDNAHGGDGELRWWDVFTAQDVLAGWYTEQCMPVPNTQTYELPCR